MNNVLELSDEVAAALQAGQPVVALESTIITHGMPWPQNLEMARRVQAEVRAHGAVPATVAVLGGRLCAGLVEGQIESLARRGTAVPKASRRDLPFLIAAHGDGATTVAATMIVAARAGIPIFATGGIGGVHRGAATSFDISADLMELARTPVAVVCAGAKAILDLKLTLEVLETHGVPVIGYRTDEFPAFYSRSSGLGVDRRLDSLTDVARVLQAQWQGGLGGGALVANPIPQSHEIPWAHIGPAIERALEEAQERGVEGAAVTPYLLARMNELTAGRSLAANVELVLNNARVAAQLAVALARVSGDPAAASPAQDAARLDAAGLDAAAPIRPTGS
ncbi:MAG: pseudouridine-5'-phosphate glycosidase [Rubrivivax sp.]|nr:pseudouridine-5'-phosphate glycosidase [Rubrivivax sp.]